jgi:hypothetical protein
VRKFTFLFLILISSNIYSQEFIKLPVAKKENPTVVFNSKIIGNLKIIDSFEQNKIKEVTVFKNKPQSDGHLNHFNNLSEYGLISIKIDKEIKSKKQSEWNIFFGFKSDNPIYIDGYLIQDPDYEIATESISEIEKVLPNSKNNLKTEILNIWTLDKIERKESDIKCGGIIPKK